MYPFSIGRGEITIRQVGFIAINLVVSLFRTILAPLYDTLQKLPLDDALRPILRPPFLAHHLSYACKELLRLFVSGKRSRHESMIKRRLYILCTISQVNKLTDWKCEKRMFQGEFLTKIFETSPSNETFFSRRVSPSSEVEPKRRHHVFNMDNVFALTQQVFIQIWNTEWSNVGEILKFYIGNTRSIERWCSSLPLLGVIRFTPRIVAHVHGTIFLHGLNISHDYLNFHSPWSMVFRYERLASSFRNDTLFLQETSLFSVPINYALLNSSYRVTRFVFIRIILSKIFSLSIQDRERLADKIRNREFWNNFIATFPSILESYK